MTKCWKLKLIIILLVAVTSTGCALGLIDQALGDKKARPTSLKYLTTSHVSG